MGGALCMVEVDPHKVFALGGASLSVIVEEVHA